LRFTRRYDSLYLHNLGSEGTVPFSLVWQPFVKPGLRLGFDQWDEYRITHERIKYYNTQNPYTNLFFVQGAQKFQRIEALHTQNILPNWNAAILINRQAAAGWYGNQGTALSNLGINTWYHSPNRRYMAAGSAIFNTFDAEENGGIKNLEIFDSLSPADRTRIAPWLSEARQRFKEQEFFVRQFLYFGEMQEQKINDTFTAKVLKPRFYLSHSIGYSKYRYNYSDKDPDTFYLRLYYDSSKISDEYGEQKLINRGAIGYTKPDTTRNRLYFLQGYAEHEYAMVRLKEDTFNFPDNIRLGFDGTASGKGGLSVSGYTYLTGYNAGDYQLKGRLDIPFDTILGMTHAYAFGGAQGYSPSIIQQRFVSGYSLWSRNFHKTNVLQIGGGFSGLKNSYLEAAYQIADGLIYYGSDTTPIQADTAIHYVRLTLNKLLSLGDFHFDHNITYQQVLRGEGMRIPDIIWRSSYYFQTYLWRQVMLFQTGVDLSYNSSYYAFGYRPGFSGFFRQDSIKVGNYPVLGFWLAGQVKRFHFFAKMEHANAGFTGSNYFMVPCYPLYPRTYRVGVRWWFYN
jgi:hypothetical protein